MITTAAINLNASGEIRDATGAAKDITTERVSEGVYRLHGTEGMPAEGWRVSVPQDDNGHNLFQVQITEQDDGDIEIATTTDDQPHDIDADRVLTIRFAVEVPDPVEEDETDANH